MTSLEKSGFVLWGELKPGEIVEVVIMQGDVKRDPFALRYISQQIPDDSEYLNNAPDGTHVVCEGKLWIKSNPKALEARVRITKTYEREFKRPKERRK